MAKDPAFLFYPGDASEETQFMNRLERGAYFDILKAQKKFGKFSKEQVRKVLGSDFDTCWPSLELVLKLEDGFYFIEWVAEKIEERKKFSESRRKNREKKEKIGTSDEDMINKSFTSEQDMVDGIEDENGIEDEFKNKDDRGQKFLVPEMFETFKKEIKTYPGSIKLDYKPLLSIANFLCDQASVEGGPENNVDKVLEAWKSVCLVIKDDNFYSQKSLSTISNHIQEILQQALHGKKSNHSKIAVKPTTDDLAAAHARRYPVGQ